HHQLLGLRVALRYGFQAGVERLYQSRALEGDPVGNPLDAMLHDPVHHPYVLGESAARRLESGSDPHALVNRALRVDLTLAIEALAARDMVERDDPVAGTKARHAAAHGSYDARSLVTVHARRGEK